MKNIRTFAYASIFCLLAVPAMGNPVSIGSDAAAGVCIYGIIDTVSQNRTQYPLSKPTVERTIPGMSGTLLVTLKREKVARCCEIHVAQVDAEGTIGEFRPSFFCTSSRNVKVDNLTPGVLYAIQGRAMGGSNGSLDWSDIVIQRTA